jgi:phosphoribosylanthranilate isomerase
MPAIKICGLREAAHALVAAEAGADLLGFIFAPSRRQVDVAQVAAIRGLLRASGCRPDLVGVFVNAPAAEIRATVARCELDVAQLSGDEPLSILDELPGLRIIKTIRMTGRPEELAWMREGAHHDHVRLHVDAHVPGSYGGAGVVADWERAAALARRSPILLAGGLTATNVAEAVQRVQPWGVDVSSGVEHDGIKDSAKIRDFIAAARNAAVSLA